ncbi:MAG TPA: hypothetical protein VIW24_00750 [Aldersonia sp.]
MAFRDGEHVEAGAASRYRYSTDAVATRYLTEKTRAFLQSGLTRMEAREFCSGCPAALLCAAAEVELNRHAPGTGAYARRTFAGLSITTTDGTDHAPVCFDKIVRAVTGGYLFEAADNPNESDPLDPRTQQLLWLADRVRGYAKDAAARVAGGHLL